MADAAPVVSSANRLSITAQTVRVMRRWVRLQSPYGLPSTHPASSPLLVVTLVPQGKQHRTSSCAYAHATPPSTWRRQICADPQHHRQQWDAVQLMLSVNAENLPAKRLYTSHGFQSFGLEPRAMKVGDRFYDEEHMCKQVV